MKHGGETSEYSRERMDDLMRVYDDYISSCDYIVMSEVYRTICDKPSRRFWVSDIRAALVVSAMMRGAAKLNEMWPLRREMYEEIYRRVMSLREKLPELTISELCARVVAQPAPKFYLTPGSVKVMVCKERKRWRQEKRKRLRLL